MSILWPAEVAQEIIQVFRHTLETGEPFHSRDFVRARADKDVVEAYEWELHRVALPDGTRVSLATTTTHPTFAAQKMRCDAARHEWPKPWRASCEAAELRVPPALRPSVLRAGPIDGIRLVNVQEFREVNRRRS
jgi:hypothetical protein